MTLRITQTIIIFLFGQKYYHIFYTLYLYGVFISSPNISHNNFNFKNKKLSILECSLNYKIIQDYFSIHHHLILKKKFIKKKQK